jgi:hypothetical protein
MSDKIESRLAVIEAVVLRIEDRLFGNGQPGELDALTKRLSTLEHSRSYVKGVLWVIGLFTTGVGAAVIKHVFSAIR